MTEPLFEDDVMLFADEDPEQTSAMPLGTWKMLVADDDAEVHRMTRIVLDGFRFENRGLELLHAYSGAETKEIMAAHPDISVLLLDVMMEEDDAGLVAVEHIRRQLGNKTVRIILRTGQPGQFPEQTVMTEYDIHDFKEKTELTTKKLFTAVISALRSYRDLNKIEHQRNQLEVWNDELEHKVRERTRAIRNLLDHAGQGFCSFGRDLVMETEYSAECVRIFRGTIEGRNLSELLYPLAEQADQRTFLRSVFEEFFGEQDSDKRELYISLLPEEVILFGAYIRLDYKEISWPDEETPHSVMAVLTDITEKRELERQRDREQAILRMIVKAVSHPNDFYALMSEFNLFNSVYWEDLQQPDIVPEAAAVELFRKVHTLKGNFAQLHFADAAEQMHQFEHDLTELLWRVKPLNPEAWREFLSVNSPDAWVSRELGMLRDKLGDDFVIGNEQLLTIDEVRLAEIEHSLLSLLTPGVSPIILREIRKLRHRPLRDLVRTAPSYVADLSARLQKSLVPMVVEGGEETANLEPFLPFSRSLVHVFRNILDHGIEPEEERILAGKPPQGTICCRLSLDSDSICFTVSDDGRGIDTDVIKSRLIETGLLDARAAAGLTDNEAVSWVWHDAFSTKLEINSLSGRGVGLSAVRHEVEKLGGQCSILTKPGQGTDFHFVLPLPREGQNPGLEAADIAVPFGDAAAFLLHEQVNVPMTEAGLLKLAPVARAALHDVSIFMQVKGLMNGTFILSLEEELAAIFLSRMSLQEIDSAHLSAYAADGAAELLNLMVYKTVSRLPEDHDFLHTDPTVTLRTRGGAVQYAGADLWGCTLELAAGKLSLYFADESCRSM